MKASSAINTIHKATLGNQYERVATYLRAAKPAKRRSYVPYLGSVYECQDETKEVIFQSECLLPQVDGGRRPHVLLLFSNAHPESIKRGMFHTAESGIAELWTDLHDVGLLSGDRCDLADVDILRKCCLEGSYDGPFYLGFACYWLFPTFHPEHLRELFSTGREPPGFSNPQTRLKEILELWEPVAIVSFNGIVYQELMSVSTRGYLTRIATTIQHGIYQREGRSCHVFQTYPAAWRYHKDAAQLRRTSLRRISDCVLKIEH